MAFLCQAGSKNTTEDIFGCPRKFWDTAVIRASPHFSPGDAVIAPDFLRQWVPATESVSGYTVEEARTRWRKKDKQDKSAGQPICTAIAARRVAPRDGRNERIKRSV